MATSCSTRSSNDEDHVSYFATDPDLEEEKNLSKYANCSFADIQSTRESRRAIGDEIKDKCKDHGDKLKELYCKDHKVFLCTICVALDHRTCEIGYIPKLSEDIFDDQEYKSFKNSLKVLAKSLSSIRSIAERNIAKSESEANNALAKLQKFRKEINDYLNKVEKDVVDKIQSVKIEDQKKIEQLSTRCNILYKEVQNLHHNLADKENKNQKCQLFVDIQMHTQAQTLDKYRNEVSKLSYMNRVRQLGFIPSRDMSVLISNQCAIGKVKFGDKNEYEMLDFSKMTFALRSIECISDGICATKEINGELTLIDTNRQKVIDRKQSDRVWFFNTLWNTGTGSYITNVSENGIAVIVQNGIDIYSTTNGLRLQKTIKLSPKNKLLALAYANNKFVVAIDASPPNMCIVDMNGEVVTAFPAKKDGRNLFKDPRFLAVNPDQTLIYVTDYGTDTVTCLTFRGDVRAKYGQLEGLSLGGVAVSRDGTVYVRVCRSIQILSSDLEELGPCFIPYGYLSKGVIAYCAKQHKLYVVSGSSRDTIVAIDL